MYLWARRCSPRAARAAPRRPSTRERPAREHARRPRGACAAARKADHTLRVASTATPHSVAPLGIRHSPTLSSDTQRAGVEQYDPAHGYMIRKPARARSALMFRLNSSASRLASSISSSSRRIKSEKLACGYESWATVANLSADRSESGGETMSQGRKETPEPTVFVNAADLYRSLPRSEFYERLAQVLDLDFIYELTQPLYAPRMGRPSLDPVVFFKCMLIGFFENILSDTELEYRIADSLTLRRFLGYSLAERTPDESTLRKTRQRMPEEVFRAVFARVLAQCQAAA